jgi:DNA-binding MarR family transcriptional regulator
MRVTTPPSAPSDPDTSPETAATQLAEALGRLVRTVRRSFTAPLPAGAFSALATVVRQGRVRLGDLAEQEGVQPSTLSRVVALLEREGYVERVVDTADRRSAFLAPTPLGRETYDEVTSSRGRALVARMSRLSDEERRRVIAAVPVLERLAADE